MILVAYRFLFVISLGYCIDVLGAAMDKDTVVKPKFGTLYKAPDSSLYYHGTWYGFLKQTLIIGSIELQDSSFSFTPLHGLPGWPPEIFEEKFPFNSQFKVVTIAYKDIMWIRYTGKVKLKNGAKHLMFGIRRKYWRPIYLQIKARVKAVNESEK
jgi:hypothetical protein